MAKAFSIRDFMQDARQQESESDVYERVSVYDIGLNPKNEYTLSEIEKIKDSIYALGGVQQNVVLVRCPEGADHTYLALDGHRRLTASRELVSEGYAEFEYVPAVIKGRIDADTEEAMLVMMNSTQRNKTDWEKVMEHMRLKEIIPKLKKRQGIDGRTRDIEADMLGVSRGQINIYNTIGTRLNAELMEMLKNGSINISLAYEAAKQEPDIQNRVAGLICANGNISEDDMRQLTMPEINKENVPESGTFEERSCEPAVNVAVVKNVPESGTVKEQQRESVSALGEIEQTDVAEDIKNVPESGTFKEQQREPVSALGEIEQADVAEDIKNVPESGTFKEQLAAVDGEPKTKIRGGYELTLIDDLIDQYASYLRTSGRKQKNIFVNTPACWMRWSCFGKSWREERNNDMTYEELEINTEIAIKEKSHEEQRTHKTVRYMVVKKYPGMCIVMDKCGRRRGIAIGELIMNKIITQEPYFESLRNEHIKASKGWHKKDSGVAGECAP